MATKVQLNKVSRVASPHMFLNEDLIEDSSLDDSSMQWRDFCIERLQTYSTPASQAHTIVDCIPSLHSENQCVTNSNQSDGHDCENLFNPKAQQREALISALSLVR